MVLTVNSEKIVLGNMLVKEIKTALEKQQRKFIYFISMDSSLKVVCLQKQIAVLSSTQSLKHHFIIIIVGHYCEIYSEESALPCRSLAVLGFALLYCAV